MAETLLYQGVAVNPANGLRVRLGHNVEALSGAKTLLPQDAQFQQLLMATGMGAPPAPQGGGGTAGPPGVDGGVMSSPMQGFPQTPNPNQAPPGTPGGPGPRVNPVGRM